MLFCSHLQSSLASDSTADGALEDIVVDPEVEQEEKEVHNQEEQVSS